METTSLEKLKAGMGFTWGELIQLHEIGKYTFGEYHPWKRDGITVLTGEADTITNFHVWINGWDSARSYSSLEAAMAGAIAYAFDGANSQAGVFFCRMVGIED